MPANIEAFVGRKVNLTLGTYFLFVFFSVIPVAGVTLQIEIMQCALAWEVQNRTRVDPMTESTDE